MKIAVILANDTFNLRIMRLIKELLHRGHEVEGFATYHDQNHLYMFEGVDFSIQDAKDLTRDLLEQYDVLFALRNIFWEIRWLIDADIYTISFEMDNFDEPYIGTDLVLRAGASQPVLQCGHRAECAYLISGDPKHDTWNLQDITEIPNRLLFIDCGHYPFGAEGKRELAKFLLDVCSRFPDYNLVVKPRFLKGDKNISHSNILHLYDFIEEEASGNIPSNLTLLPKHYTLEELIASSHTVICMYTTAYIDAVVQGKNLIILDNLPNEEHPELRIKSHWMPVRELLRETGCLVDYREAINYLPEGIPCSEEHIKANIYSRGAINSKIVKSIEWFWENYLSQNKYPAPADYYYDKLEDSQINTISMEELKPLRKKNYLYWMERHFYRCTTYFPDDHGLECYINDLERTGQLQEHSINDLIPELCEKLLDYAENIPKDRISQDYLLIQILNSNNLEKLSSLKREEVPNKVFYDFVAGKSYFSNADYLNASRSLHSYLDGCVSCDSADSLHDLPKYHLSGLYYCGLADMKLQRYEEAKQCFLECEKETDGNHRMAKEQLEIIYQIEKQGG